MIQVQLWAFAPGNDAGVILPRPLTWDAGFALNDISSLNLTYPVDQAGIEMLSDYCDVEVRYWSGTEWVCPPQGRFSLFDAYPNVESERNQPTRRFTFKSYAWQLDGVHQSHYTGLNDDGARDFPNQSLAQIVGTLISEAHSAGAAPDLSFQNVSAQTGGLSPALEPGYSALRVLTSGVDNGDFEWVVQPDATGQGRKLCTYSTLGTDKSTGNNPVQLRSGRDVSDAPAHRTITDMAGQVLVKGDNDLYYPKINANADTPYGRLQAFVGANGLTSQGALDIVADSRLNKGARWRTEHTREVRFDTAQFFPFIDYNLGDTVRAPGTDGTPEAMRVQQITLSFDKGLTGNLVLGDRFEVRQARLEKVLTALTSGSSGSGGKGPNPKPPNDDNRKPKAPTGFNVGSAPYTTEDGTYLAVGTFGWVWPTEATDGSAMTPAKMEIWGRKGSSGVFYRVTTVDYNDNNIDWSPFDAGVLYQFKVRALSKNNVEGPYSSVVAHTMGKDTTPPPVASKLTFKSRLGTGTVTWDGKGANNETMPADFKHGLIERAANSGFTSGKVSLGYLSGAGDVVDAPLIVGDTYYYRITLVDRAGNAADPSAVTSGEVIGVTGPDLEANSVTANVMDVGYLSLISGDLGEITAGSITSALFQQKAGGGSTARNVVIDNDGLRVTKDAGEFLVNFRIGANPNYVYIHSRSNPGFELHSNKGLAFWNAAGTNTFRLNTADGSITMTGSLVSGGTITGTTINGTNINGGTISGTTYKSAGTGKRIEIQSSGGGKIAFISGASGISFGNAPSISPYSSFGMQLKASSDQGNSAVTINDTALTLEGGLNISRAKLTLDTSANLTSSGVIDLRPASLTRIYSDVDVNGIINVSGSGSYLGGMEFTTSGSSYSVIRGTKGGDIYLQSGNPGTGFVIFRTNGGDIYTGGRFASNWPGIWFGENNIGIFGAKDPQYELQIRQVTNAAFQNIRASSFDLSSSVVHKTSVTDIDTDTSLQDVLATPIKTYQRSSEVERYGAKKARRRLGPIAEDAPASIVSGVGDSLGIDVGSMVSLLWAAVQQLARKIETLEAKG